MPKCRSAREVLAVKSVDAVVFRGNENYIVQAAVHAQIRHEQGLCVDVSIHAVGIQLAKTLRVDVLGRQYAFTGVEPGAQIVVVPCDHIGADSNRRSCALIA